VNAKPEGGIKPHNGCRGLAAGADRGARQTRGPRAQRPGRRVSVDDDPTSRAPQGILSLQLEGSGQVWYRNVYVKNLGN
jgi:hypothetical protein